MFSGVEYVREICNKRKIPISQLEKDCGFANGYLNPKKLQKIPYDRAKKIAEYLDLSLDYLLNGTAETEKAPTQEGERIADLSPAFFRLKQGLEPYDLSEADADFLLEVYKAHIKKNQ